MQNATKIYNDSDRSKKAPGQWLSLKTTKSQLNDELFFNKRKSDYFFSEGLFVKYKDYLDGLVEETKDEKQPEDLSDNILKFCKDKLGKDHYDYILNKAIMRVLGNNSVKAKKLIGHKSLISVSTPLLKQIVSAFLYAVTLQLQSVKGTLGRHGIDRVMSDNFNCLSPHLLYSKTSVLFEDESMSVTLLSSGKLHKQEK